MPKRARSTSTSQQRREEEEGGRRKEIRSKSRNERATVNERIIQLLHSGDSAKLYGQVFSDREVVQYKYVNMVELTKMFNKDNIDTAQYLVNQEWVDFVTINRPICEYLLRVLMANLENDTMISWIGRRKVDLSEETWCRVFGLPNITSQDEEPIMSVAKEDIFFRLTGIHNLGVQQFIKINQLHQDAAMRLSAQVVMTILVPKKGSKEQIRLEEGRILYALMTNQKINLVKTIVSRLRSTLGRKSVPISYGMHLMAIMEDAGVDLKCTGEKEKNISSPIDHHTLRRLGFKEQFGGWTYVGRRYATTSTQQEGQGEHGEEEQQAEEGQEEGNQEHTQAESSAPSRPRPSHIPTNLRFQSQNLVTKTDIAHLQNFLVEQMHLMQATLLSKLDSLDSRVQNCETHLRLHHPLPPSPIHHPPVDPKGKGPMPYPSPSPHHTASSPHSPIIPSSHQSPIPSPQHSPLLPLFHSSPPQPIPVHSSSSSSALSPSHYTIAPHTTPSQASNDSEATHSNPPSKPSSPIPPTPTPTTSPLDAHPSPKPTPPPITAAYHRRRIAVSKLFPPNFPRLMPPP